MTEEQINEVMRLADERADACAGCDSSHFALGQRAELEAYLRTIGKPAGYTFPPDSMGAKKFAQVGEGFAPVGLVFSRGESAMAISEHGRVYWDRDLVHPISGEPEQRVNAELLEALKELQSIVEIHSSATGDNFAWAELELSTAAIARAESAIEISPEPASPDLLESARAVVARWDAPTWKDLPATAEYIGRLRVAIAQADLDGALTAEEWVAKNVSGSPGLVRAMVIRAEAAESAIETPAKVSPCAGHAVQQEADERPRDIVLKVAGKSFRCSCGCNVFQKLDPDNENEYTCNACHATYEAGGA